MLKRKGGNTVGQRHKRDMVVETEGGSKKVPKERRYGRKKSGGRNNRGVVTVGQKGGGVKRSRRKREAKDENLNEKQERKRQRGRVRGIQYDPNRTGRVARRKVRKDGRERKNEYKYVLAVEGRKVGEVVEYGGGEGMKGVTLGSTVKRKRRQGVLVCNVEVREGEGGKYRRSAGICGMRMASRGGKVKIRMKGGKYREVSTECTATVGRVTGEDHIKACRGKAGRSRRRGKRPKVRGEAMNPIDHPHGGRTRGGRAEVTPWSRRAKGVKTRKKGKKRGRGWEVIG